MTAPFLAVSTRPRRELIAIRAGEILEECVCCGPLFRFIVLSGVPRKPLAFECESSTIEENTRPFKRA